MSIIEQIPTRTGGPLGNGLGWWQAGLAGLAVAAVANIVIYAVARVAGAPFEVVDGDTRETVDAAAVLFLSIVPMAIGYVIAVLASLRWLWALRAGAAIGAGLALITISFPFMVEASGGTQAALALMHVTLAGAIVLAFEAYRRRRLATASASFGR